MRTRANIHLDEDAYSFASAYAAARGMPLGAAISELLRQRQAAQGQELAFSPRLKTISNGLLIRASSGGVVTPEMVKSYSEDELD